MAGSGWPTCSQDAGYELHLAHPMRTKAIASARVKTDAVDARTLAHLLRADLLPEAYIAPRELRDLRDLLRHRVALTRMRSALKNRVSRGPGQEWHPASLQRPVRPGRPAVFSPSSSCASAPRRRLDSHAGADRRLHARDRRHQPRDRRPRQRRIPTSPVLCQIRGVGRYIAMLVIAEVGDITRFPTARQLCSWAGLTPTVRSSDGKARLGHISQAGLPAAALGLGRGRPARRRRRRPAAPKPTNGSPSAAASRSPRSPSPARSSPSASTGCATERSVAWHPGPRRARSEQRRSTA